MVDSPAVTASNVTPLGYPSTIPTHVAQTVHGFMYFILINRKKALDKHTKQDKRKQMAELLKPHVKHIMFSKHHDEAIILTLKNGSVFWATVSENQHISAQAIAYLKTFATNNYGKGYVKKLLQLAPLVDLEQLSYEKSGKLKAYAHHAFIKLSNQKHLKKFLRRFGYEKVAYDKHRLVKNGTTYFMDYGMCMHKKFPQQENEIAAALAQGTRDFQTLVTRSSVIFAQKLREAKRDIKKQMTGLSGDKGAINDMKQALIAEATENLQEERSVYLHHVKTALTKARQLSYQIGNVRSQQSAARLAAQVEEEVSLISRTVHNIARKETHVRKMEQDAKRKKQEAQLKEETLNKARQDGLLQVKDLHKATDAMLVHLEYESNPYMDMLSQFYKLTNMARNAASLNDVQTVLKSAKNAYAKALAWTQSLGSETSAAA